MENMALTVGVAGAMLFIPVLAGRLSFGLMFADKLYEKIKQLLKRGNTKYIPLREDQQEFFLNCNTPEELEKLKKEKITLD